MNQDSFNFKDSTCYENGKKTPISAQIIPDDNQILTNKQTFNIKFTNGKVFLIPKGHLLIQQDFANEKLALPNELSRIKL